MRDPSEQIYQNFGYALDDIYYRENRIVLLRSRAQVNQGYYILLDWLEAEDDLTDSYPHSTWRMRIEISAGPYQQDAGDVYEVHEISDKVLQAIVKQDIYLVSSLYKMSVTPFVTGLRSYEERDPDNNLIYKKKEIIIQFGVYEV